MTLYGDMHPDWAGDGLVTADPETEDALHTLAVHDMRAENDEDMCTSCGVRPTWIGTMCQQCAEASRPKPKPKLEGR